MLRQAVFLSFIVISVAFIHEVPELLDNKVYGNNGKIIYLNAVREKVWVLKLDGAWDHQLQLRPATPDEEEDFEENAGPLIESYKRGHRTVKKGSHTPPAKEDEVGKKDIFKLLNKFALYNEEPDTYLMESHKNDGPSLAIYFQGPFTSLTLTVGNREWDFFMHPPSYLPAWFYTRTDEDLVVPETVEPQFYATLYRLLNLFMRMSP